MADCEQPTRAPTKLRFRQFQRFIFSRLTVGPEIRHGNPPFLRLTAEFERSEKPATSSDVRRKEAAERKTASKATEEGSGVWAPDPDPEIAALYEAADRATG